jgi:hypothetical protein
MRAKFALFLASGMVLGGATVGPALGTEAVGLSAKALTTGHGGDFPGSTAVKPSAAGMSVYSGYSASNGHGAHGVRAQAPVPDVPAVTTPGSLTLAPVPGQTNVCPSQSSAPTTATTPDCITALTLTVGPGPLELQVPLTWNLGANAQPGTAVSSVFPSSSTGFLVSDARGQGTGGSNWTVYVSLTAPFTFGANQLGNVAYNPGAQPAGITGTAVPTLTSTPALTLSATGIPGITQWAPTLTVDVPAAAPSGAYTADLNTWVVAG